jgi:thioredoxin reductase
VSQAELRAYPTLTVQNIRVIDIVPDTVGFCVVLADGSRVTCRKVLLATGLEVELPPIQGIEQLYGRGVYDCPYCDGWEVSDGAIAIYGRGAEGKDLAIELLGWSKDVTLFTGGTSLSQEDRNELRRFQIEICNETIDALYPTDEGILIQTLDGRKWRKKGLFFVSERREVPPLIKKLGCHLTDRGVVSTGANECTNIFGVYVAGDASRRASFAVVAAAEGALAAFAISQELLKEERGSA